MVYDTTDGELNHREIIDQFSRIENIERDQRKKSIKDLLFINDESGQWEEDVYRKRADRPRLTVDRVTPAIMQVVGEQLQDEIAIKVSPQGDSKQETADIYTGLVRSIEQLSSATNCYNNAMFETVAGGYGGWRIMTEFPDDITFDLDIIFKPINSAASSLYFDPDAESYDKRDARFAFYVSKMSKEEYFKKWPDQPASDFEQETYQSWQRDWIDDDTVKVAEYWYKEPYKKTIALMSDGTTIDIDEDKEALDELQSAGITIVRKRAVDSNKVKMVWISGGGILNDPVDWAGKYIPFIPMYGITSQVEEKRYCRGITRKAIDAQRIYNYTISATVEATALAPKDPLLATPAMVKNHQAQYNTLGSKNPPLILYDIDPANPAAMPTRLGAPQLQSALIQQTQQAAQDIFATTGLEPASLGQNVGLKSGKAIQAEQAMGDRGSYIFKDNLQKSIAYTGEILIDLIPRIYDTERIVQISKPDGSLEEVTINQQGSVEDSGINKTVTDEQTGDEILVNDLSQGRYSVSIKTGPAYSTKKQETVDQLIQLSQGSELIKNLTMDLVVKNLDINNGDEIAARVRKHMIKQQLIDPTDEEKEELGLNQPQKPDPMKEEMQANMRAQTENFQMQTEKLMADIRNKEADTENKVIQANKDSMSALTDLIQTLIKKKDAGLPITQEDVETMEGQQALAQEVQLDVLEGQEVAGTAPLRSGQPQQEAPQPGPTPEQLAQIQMMQQGGQ